MNVWTIILWERGRQPCRSIMLILSSFSQIASSFLGLCNTSTCFYIFLNPVTHLLVGIWDFGTKRSYHQRVTLFVTSLFVPVIQTVCRWISMGNRFQGCPVLVIYTVYFFIFSSPYCLSWSWKCHFGSKSSWPKKIQPKSNFWPYLYIFFSMR